MNSMSNPDILVVMVHVWENMPELENIRWDEFSKIIVDRTNLLSWPKVWQFDFINSSVFNSMQQQKIVAQAKTEPSGKVPHSDIVYSKQDWISTSDDQTALIIETLNPKIVMFGGLHKDLCVTGVQKAVWTDRREYFVSDRLAFTWKDTAAAIYKDW